MWLRKILFAIVLLGVGTTSAHGFSDHEGSQYNRDIEALRQQGIIEGYNDGTFRPFASVTRAEFLKMITGIAKAESTEGDHHCFSDVRDEWFAGVVCGAVRQGWVQGYADGTFRPGQEISMVEAQAMAVRVFGFFVPKAEETETWYAPLVDFFHRNTLFSKYSYQPWRPMRREEAAFLLHQIMRVRADERILTGVRTAVSSGCGLTPPSEIPVRFDVRGEERAILISIPRGYRPNHAYPIVFAFHGRTNTNAQVRSYFRLDRVFGEEAIIIYPQAKRQGGGHTWSGDEVFFDELLRTLKPLYCIDEDRVFVTGHSLGAVFANDLACMRGDQIRGVVSVGGGRTRHQCSGPVAAMIWHHPQDNLVPLSEGVAARESIRRQNAATEQTVGYMTPIAGNCMQYTGGHPDAPIVWCPHSIDRERDGTYYPHLWPREMAEIMWEFWGRE